MLPCSLLFDNLHSKFRAFDADGNPLFDQAGESLVGCDLFANVGFPFWPYVLCMDHEITETSVNNLMGIMG